jgi:hypothetical protein
VEARKLTLSRTGVIVGDDVCDPDTQLSFSPSN